MCKYYMCCKTMTKIILVIMMHSIITNSDTLKQFATTVQTCSVQCKTEACHIQGVATYSDTTISYTLEFLQTI